MKTPKVSVIMPAYNHEMFVSEAIESVLSQTLQDFEFIIINDGSTDGTDSVIKRYNDSRITYYRQENIGISKTINRGLELARGAFISIINSDDVYNEKRLDVLLQTATGKALDFLITDLNLINENSEIINDADHWWLKWYNYLKSAYNASEGPHKAFLAGNYAITASNFFFRADIIKQIGHFKPYQYIADYDFAFRASCYSPEGFCFLIGEKLLSYRLHGRNTIFKNPLVANHETFYFLKNAFKTLYGEAVDIPLNHLNTIKKYILKETIQKYKTTISVLNEEKGLLITEIEHKDHELQQKTKEISIKDHELRLRTHELQHALSELSESSNYNINLLNELYIIRNSYSFKSGRAITFPLRLARRLFFSNSRPHRLKTSVDTVEKLQPVITCLIDKLHIVSFDIFDTVFERDIDPPDKVKEVVARYFSGALKEGYGITLSYHEILRLRNNIELELRHRAISNGKDFECCYDDILREMIVHILGKYDEKLASSVTNKELEVENEVLYIKKGIPELLGWLKEKNKKVIAISDMYLNKEHIERILQLKSLDHFFDSVYISSEMAICKYSGNLFRHVLLKEKVLPNQMLHIGDNRISDHEIPAKLGIHTIHLKDKSHLRKKYILKTYNKLAANNIYWRGRHLLQLIRTTNGERAYNFFYRYGYSFLGPIYSTYMLGVVEAIKKYRINKCFFIAREGELFQRIFNLLAPYYFSSDNMPASKYVYLTRKSTALASAYMGLSHEKAIIPFFNPKQQGIFSLLKVFGLPPEDFADIIKEHGFSDIKEPLYNWHDERLTSLLNDSNFQVLVKKYAQYDRELLQRYLEQIGFFGRDSKVAFIDVGWNATIQKFVQDAFEAREDFPHVYGLYLGFRDGIKHSFNREKNTIIGMLYDDNHNNPIEKVINRFEEVFEEGARALHPTTIGYIENKENGLIEPVFRDSANEDRKEELKYNEKIKNIHSGVMDFSKEFIRAVDLTGYTFEDLKPFMLTMIERAIAYPNSEEVENLMNLKHSEDFGYENVMDLSVDAIKSIGSILNPVKLWNKIKISNWPYGTARSSGIPGINVLLRLYDILRAP